MGTFFFVGALITVLLNILAHWNMSKGNMKVVYVLNLFVYASYFIIETSLALNSPEQIGILLFNLLNIWAFIMAVKGIIRLRKEKKENQNESEAL